MSATRILIEYDGQQEVGTFHFLSEPGSAAYCADIHDSVDYLMEELATKFALMERGIKTA